eukprot:1158470-Pelagomonas_calceolata.AAC.4
MHEEVNLSKILVPVYVWSHLQRRPDAAIFPKNFLANVTFFIPVQTAIVERGFSVHHIVRSRLSGRVNTMTLDSLIRIKLLTLGQDLNSFDFGAAVAAHTYVPVTSREDMKLRELYKKVDEIELDLLCDGVDEDDEPGFDISKENEVVEEVEKDVGGWMSSKEEEAGGDDGKDCFGVHVENERESEMDKGADFEVRAAAELNDL